MFRALIKKELLSLSRDIHGMGALFVMPMVFIVVMSMALKDVYTPAVKSLAYAVVNRDGGAASQQLLARWAEERGEPVAALEHWQDEVRSGRLKYALLIEPGFSRAVADLAGEGAVKLRLLAEPGLDNSVFETSHMRLAAMVTQMRAERLMKQLPRTQGLAAAGLMGDGLVSAERVTAGPLPTSVQQNVPAWLVFGMFFVVASIAGLFVEERSCGALARLRSMGVRPQQIIISKIFPYLLVNGVQAMLMLAVGVWLMPLIGGEALSLQNIHWGALALMLFATSLAAVSLALAVACLVRTHAQAATFGPILNVLMAAFGGIMVPLFVMPAVMQRIAAYSPMNWSLEGLLDVLLRSGDVASVLPETARLAAFAGLMFMIAFLLFRRRV